MLGAGEVHVWEACPERFADEAARRASLLLLSSDERSRHDRFAFDRDRHAFLVAHAMLRHVLAGHVGRPPAALAFVTGPRGRPELEGAPPPVRFSLSHTSGMVACAVTHRLACGIDVEDVGRAGGREAVAARIFAPAEIAGLEALPPDSRRERFFALWTLKESVGKALGCGLGLPFEEFEIELDTPRGDMLRSSIVPGPWWLRRWRPSDRHRAALAIHSHTGEPLPVRRMRWEGPG